MCSRHYGIPRLPTYFRKRDFCLNHDLDKGLFLLILGILIQSLYERREYNGLVSEKY